MKLPMVRSSSTALFVGLALCSAFAIGQNPAPVVELGESNPVAPKVASQADANLGVVISVPGLREEVRQLRGMVEQLSYELQRVNSDRWMTIWILTASSAQLWQLLKTVGRLLVDGQSLIPTPDEQPLNR